MNPTRRSRFRGALLGLAAGGAVGISVEFRPCAFRCWRTHCEDLKDLVYELKIYKNGHREKKKY